MQERNIQLEERFSQYPQWISKFQCNPRSGFLVDDDYKLQFDYEPFKNILERLPQLIKSGKIIQEVQNFPRFNYACKDYRGKLALRQAVLQLVNSYIWKMKKNQVEESKITIPESLAKPLYEASNDLKMKYGMCGIVYNWYLYNKEADMEDLKIEDIRLRWYFTESELNQRLFFGASVIGTHFLAKIIRLIYEINQIIDISPQKEHLVAQRLKKIKVYLQKITTQTRVLLGGLDANYFFNELRSYLAGFNVTFKGVEDGTDKLVSSTGGNAGYDPSFQTFERGIGIFYKQEYERIQTRLEIGMHENSRKLIAHMRDKSQIREYCSCTKEFSALYNSVIRDYVIFLKAHSAMVSSYILKFMQGKTKEEAKGNSGEMIRSLIQRYQAVQKQFIREK